MTDILIILGALTRVIPHPPNLTAVGAIGIFAGANGSKKWFWVTPLATMAITDAIIGFYWWPIMTSVYLSFVISSLLSFVFLRSKKNVIRIAIITLISSVIFYIITNFAVWAWSPMYAKNWSGLAESYVLALPFFRNSLLGDLAYTGILFGVYKFILVRRSNRQWSTDKQLAPHLLD